MHSNTVIVVVDVMTNRQLAVCNILNLTVLEAQLQSTVTDNSAFILVYLGEFGIVHDAGGLNSTWWAAITR